MRVLLFNTLVLVICSYAFFRGGAPERIVALMFIVAAALTRAVIQHMVQPYQQLEANLLLIDVALLSGLIVVALSADRYWPMTMAALQIVLVGVHLTKMINPRIIPSVYAVSLGLWSYPMIILLGCATYRHRRRLKENGVDRSWSLFSNRSQEDERVSSEVH